GGGGAQERRRHEGHREDEGAANGRPALRQGNDSGRRPQDPPGLSGRGEEAGGVEVPVGLLQDSRDDPGRAGLPPARPGWLRAGEEISTAIIGSGGGRRGGASLAPPDVE